MNFDLILYFNNLFFLGVVYRGIWREREVGLNFFFFEHLCFTIILAVKQLKAKEIASQQRKEFLIEFKLMRYIKFEKSIEFKLSLEILDLTKILVKYFLNFIC